MKNDDSLKTFNPWYDETVSSTRGKAPRPAWDVRVTLIRKGDGANNMQARFSFCNKAAEVFSEMSCVEISSVKKSPKRIFFRAYEEDGAKLRAQGKRAYKLCANSNSKSNRRYAVLTPMGDEEKIYRMNWMNNAYLIKYDEEERVYYIDAN